MALFSDNENVTTTDKQLEKTGAIKSTLQVRVALSLVVTVFLVLYEILLPVRKSVLLGVVCDMKYSYRQGQLHC